MIFALAGALIGAALAGFTVLALIPVMAGAVIIAWTSALVAGATIAATLVDLAVLLAAMQIGYVSGAFVRLSMARNVKRQSAPRTIP